jgi:hypothetical protein
MLSLILPFLLVVADRPFDVIHAMKPVITEASDSPARKLLKERYNTRLQALQGEERRSRQSWCDVRYCIWMQLSPQVWQFAESAADLETTPADRVKWYGYRVAALRRLEVITALSIQLGFEDPQMLHIARAGRIDAEIELLKLKESLKGEK